MLSRIDDAIRFKTIQLVSRFNELPSGVRVVILAVPTIVLIFLGIHFGILSKGHPGNHIPAGWHQ